MTDDALSPSRIFPDLRLGRYRFVLEPKGPISLPAYQGSTWRGVIGTALTSLFCPWPRVRCQKCSAYGSCAYGFLYEASSEEKGFSNLPRPYIFEPSHKSPDGISVDMTLIGAAGDFLPHILSAWIKAGEMGTGKGGGLFDLARVDQLLPGDCEKEIYRPETGPDYARTTFPLAQYLDAEPPPLPMRIGVMTPLRLRNKGKNMDIADWSAAFASLAVRLSLLNQRYCGGRRPDDSVWSSLKEFFQNPGLIRDSTRWYDWQRYSSRQHKHIPMGGLVGECLMSPDAAHETWWQWWQTAALFHVGKGASMGLGRVSIENCKNTRNQPPFVLKEENHAVT